jgi:hypothetical protein
MRIINRGGDGMGYTIHYSDPAQMHAHRVIPMVFRDKEAVLDCACALRRAGFRISRVEGPNFAMPNADFEAYYGVECRRRWPQNERREGGERLASI